jgi:assimilatory nitrate reductase catalytic subunit
VIIQTHTDKDGIARITGVRGDPDHPANFGRLCSKGSTLHQTARAEVTQQSRLLQPMQRFQRGTAPQAIAWDTALQLASQKFAHIIQQSGPDAVGFYVSGQLLTEDYYVFNKLVKGLIGTNNIDTNSRLCMSSAVAGYKQSLGADAPPCSYSDLDHAHTLFIAGSNTAFAHPILFRRIEDAKRNNPNLKIIVCDPRRTDTVEIADLHLAIQPGTDVMLFHGMLHLMLWEGWINPTYIHNHTEGFDALKATVRDYTPALVTQTCGISEPDLLQATRYFATSPATLSLYCQGLNQSSSGTAKNTALINLHLATGQIGKPGAGPFSLTGQPNAMGGREVGGLANLLSAHRDLSNPVHRAEVAALWGIADVPAKPGKTAVEMFQAAADGEIKALWIACTNPAHSLPDQKMVQRALERAEFVVVQESFATTTTCSYADLLLPATTWGEKEGTVTNSERRISRVRAAVAAPGQSRHDWQIATQFAQHLAHSLQLGQALRFDYESAESIWLEHRASTRGRDLDISGMSYAMLERAPQQWPLPAGRNQGKERLYEEGVFPTVSGKARFVNVQYRPVAEARSARYPFSLTTGRLRDQWHGMSRTGTVSQLFSHAPEPVLQMHPQDMAQLQISEGELVQISSSRSSLLLPVSASNDMGLRQLFIAMHWGNEYIHTGVNALTTSAFCPDSKQPEFKHCAVKVSKVTLPWSMVAMAWLPTQLALQVRTELQSCMKQFSYASCVPFAQTSQINQPAASTGLLFCAAHDSAATQEQISTFERLLQLDRVDCLRYADAHRGQLRTVRIHQGHALQTLHGFLLAGNTAASPWMRTLLQNETPLPCAAHQLLSGSAQPPQGAIATPNKTVCTCFAVSLNAIEQHLQQCAGNTEQQLQSLKDTLQCGTNCGSCIPQLQRIVRNNKPTSIP